MKQFGVTLAIKHDATASPEVLTVQVQPGSGAIKGATNVNLLDGTPLESSNFLFGKTKSEIKRKNVSELSDDYFKEGWAGSEVLFLSDFWLGSVAVWMLTRAIGF
jgi:hypothetical protein